jgi:hypothetical protein
MQIPEELMPHETMFPSVPEGYENVTEATFRYTDGGGLMDMNFITRNPPPLFTWVLVNPRPEALTKLLIALEYINGRRLRRD